MWEFKIKFPTPVFVNLLRVSFGFAGRNMRFTVKQKIILGTAGILLVGLLSMLVIYGALRTAQRAMHEVADVEEPTSAAAYEMEINVIGTGMGVLNYLDTGDPQFRARVEKDEADFERFKARYDQLADTPAGKELGNKVGALFQEFVQLGEVLMDKRDEHETLYRAIAENFEVIDGILDAEIQENLDEAGPDGQEKVLEAAAMEVQLGEVGIWLGTYLQVSVPEFRKRIFGNARDFRKHLVRFKRLRLSKTERQSTAKLEKLFNRTLSMIQKDLALNAELQEQVRRFLGLREQMDHVLDEEIQALTMKDLEVSKRMAEEAHGNVIRSISLLFPVFLLLGVAVALVLIRAITEPLEKLIEGTSAVAAGDLSHRVSQESQDEFADVARKFNLMVTKLEETTASKEELVLSEEELRQANAGLCKEIDDRRRVEKALGTSQDRYRELFEDAHDIVYTLDLAGRFTSLNKAGEQASHGVYAGRGPHDEHQANGGPGRPASGAADDEAGNGWAWTVPHLRIRNCRQGRPPIGSGSQRTPDPSGRQAGWDAGDRPRCDRAETARGAVSPGTEDGGGWATGGWRGARFQ